jgi:hypothetical protein
MKKSQIISELIECLMSQHYNHELDIYGLALIGLFELERDIINKIVDEELKSKIKGK